MADTEIVGSKILQAAGIDRDNRAAPGRDDATFRVRLQFGPLVPEGRRPSQKHLFMRRGFHSKLTVLRWIKPLLWHALRPSAEIGTLLS